MRKNLLGWIEKEEGVLYVFAFIPHFLFYSTQASY